MISFSKENGLLLLNYEPDFFSGGSQLIAIRLRDNGEAHIEKRIFTFQQKHLIRQVDEEWVFQLGILKNDYFEIEKSILGISFDLRIHKSCSLSLKLFKANRGLSVFKHIDKVLSEPITIGGSGEGVIPEDSFRLLLEQFPKKAELNHYVSSRITGILNEYFDTTTDAQEKYVEYLRKKQRKTEKVTDSPIRELSKELDIQKYEFIRDRLIKMLNSPEEFSEARWQTEILNFILLIFPKYIAVLEDLHIKDFYSKLNKVTSRYIDFTLVDANGHIDIIEIKKPFPNCIVSRGKYRDNHTPKTELSGSVMQIEKYIFHLSKWGQAGEKEIYDKRKKELPNGLLLRINNPKGMIILGREDTLTQKQLFDFEFIKRKYSNIIDIITYDDLLRRLEHMIEMLKR